MIFVLLLIKDMLVLGIFPLIVIWTRIFFWVGFIGTKILCNFLYIFCFIFSIGIDILFW